MINATIKVNKKENPLLSQEGSKEIILLEGEQSHK